MTTHKNNIKACEQLEKIQEVAGNLWGNCQMYTSGEVTATFVTKLKQILSTLEGMNKKMER